VPTLAVIFPPTQPPERIGAVAAAADAAGLAQLWLSAGATHVAVNATEDDADLVRFVRFLATEVKPLLA